MATVLSPPEQRVILHGINWDTYESILEVHRNRSAPRFTYDRGSLEIISPSPEHEELNRAAASLVEAVAEGLDLHTRNFGSTTFRREDVKRGFEPDTCFYIQSVERIKGQTELDLTVDPPPDLVIEIDITSPSITKFPLFAQVGVPEVWRYDGKRWSILMLAGAEYIEREESIALPGLTVARITHFIEEGRTMRRPDWLRWVRDSVGQSG